MHDTTQSKYTDIAPYIGNNEHFDGLSFTVKHIFLLGCQMADAALLVGCEEHKQYSTK